MGNERAEAETYLSAKIFFGHVISLADECDCMFVTGIHSMGGEAYIYSKFLSLPNMKQALVTACPPILDPEIDLVADTSLIPRSKIEL